MEDNAQNNAQYNMQHALGGAQDKTRLHLTSSNIAHTLNKAKIMRKRTCQTKRNTRKQTRNTKARSSNMMR